MSKAKICKKFIVTTAAAVLMLPAAISTNAEVRVEVGVLTCEVAAGSGMIITSKKTMNCVFDAFDDFSEGYSGKIRKFGLDIGDTDYSTIKWAVFAPTTELESGALEGTYVGLSAEATLGAGVGANALIGGFDKSITLQPFSGQVQQGLNIAAGIGTMTLRSN